MSLYVEKNLWITARTLAATFPGRYKPLGRPLRCSTAKSPQTDDITHQLRHHCWNDDLCAPLPYVISRMASFDTDCGHTYPASRWKTFVKPLRRLFTYLMLETNMKNLFSWIEWNEILKKKILSLLFSHMCVYHFCLGGVFFCRAVNLWTIPLPFIDIL